jgi:hypothetical protein
MAKRLLEHKHNVRVSTPRGQAVDRADDENSKVEIVLIVKRLRSCAAGRCVYTRTGTRTRTRTRTRARIPRDCPNSWIMVLGVLR